MNSYTVEYVAGSYFGERTVTAEDEEQAIAKVRAWVRRQMSHAMYSESYKVTSQTEDSNELDEQP